MDVRMDGRRALITGGSRGLGFAMALKFAESGADVALLARRPDRLAEARAAIVEKTGRTVWTQDCDVGDGAALAAAHAQMVAEFGNADILVNNAGSSVRGAFEELTDEMWQRDLDLKLFGAIRLARLCLPHMKAQRWGRILNVLNIGARTPRAGGAPTQVSRAAGLALTKVLAGDGAPYNVLVNGLMTGTIITDQVAGYYENSDKSQSFEDFVAERGRNVPLGRMGTAEEYANVACFLASDAGSYVTGTAINIDGNMSPVI